MPETVVAMTDIGILLCKKNVEEKFEKLVSVTSTPDTGGAPSQIEVTELDSQYKQYVSDRPDTPSFEFEFNHTEANYAAVKAYVNLTEPKEFLIVYQDGSGERFTGTGDAWIKGYSAGSGGKCGLAINVSTKSHVADTSSIMVTTP